MSRVVLWAIKTDLNSIEEHAKKSKGLSDKDRQKVLNSLNEIRKLFGIM